MNMSTEIKSKHGIVSKQPFELYMAFVDMRNFLQFLPEDKREGVTADYDTISATVQADRRSSPGITGWRIGRQD